MFWVYVLLSDKTNRRYVGSTQDVAARLVQHNLGQSKSTRHGVPRRLVYQKAFATRAEATQRERYFKTGKGREELARLLDERHRW